MQSAFLRTPSRRGFIQSVGCAAAAASFPGRALAAPDPLRVSLEFRIYGGNAPIAYGVAKGIFSDLGIAAAVDGSTGSADTVTRIASGTHDMGFADLSTMIEFTERNPDVAPKLVMVFYDRFPAVILSLNPKAIKSLDDLKGAKVGVATSDAGSKILPALLRVHGVDPDSFKRMTIDVTLRDSMLLRREVDAIVAFDYTAVFNLIGNGVKMEDINLLYFSDLGFDFVGDVLVASPALIKNNPDLVKRMALASTRSFAAAIKDRAGAIEAVVRRDRLLDPKVELQRMNWVLDKHVLTDNVKKNGLGAVTDARLQSGVDLLASGFQFKRSISVDDFYARGFLPETADRHIV